MFSIWCCEVLLDALINSSYQDPARQGLRTNRWKHRAGSAKAEGYYTGQSEQKLYKPKYL